MDPEHELTKAANSPLGRVLPNPKGKLKDQFHGVERFKQLALRNEGPY